MKKLRQISGKIIRGYLFAIGVGFSLFLIWTIFGLPIFIDRLCIRGEAPIEADYIVCVAGGLSGGNLPQEVGWERIYAAVQLYLDGYARKVIFTGGGSSRVSEAEVYAEAARWLGLAEHDAMLDPGPNQTAEHPRNIMKIAGAGITRETALDIVTSPLHSRRTALCFKKAGFTNFRMVTGYRATGRRTAVRAFPSDIPGAPPVMKKVLVSRPDASAYLRAEKTSNLPGFKQSNKAYDDILLRLKWRSAYFFNALREIAALAVYKLKGYI